MSCAPRRSEWYVQAKYGGSKGPGPARSGALTLASDNRKVMNSSIYLGLLTYMSNFVLVGLGCHRVLALQLLPLRWDFCSEVHVDA